MTESGNDTPLIFLVAGEPSGDLLGGRLMTALAEKTGGRVRFAGVGGETMSAAGLHSLFPMVELSVMGLVEVVPRIPALLRRITETAAAVHRLRPDAVVTIDAPDFSFRLARRLRGSGIPLVHYVAPTVWAWRAGRARKVARVLDHLLCLLPFEPPYFEREGLAATFVGHPVVERGADGGNGPEFRRRYDIDSNSPLLCVLPGSRLGEVSRLLPVFGETVARLAAGRPGLRVVVPTVASVADAVAAGIAEWPGKPILLRNGNEKFDAFAAADAALAASGTVALELAAAGTAAVVGYRVAPLTAWLARRLVRVRYANLVNILLDREAVPERIQERCTAEELGTELARLLDDPAARAEQMVAGAEALAALGRGGPSPGRRAAEAVLRVTDIHRDPIRRDHGR